MLLSFTLDELSCILIPNLLQRESLSSTEDTWRKKKLDLKKLLLSKKPLKPKQKTAHSIH